MKKMKSRLEGKEKEHGGRNYKKRKRQTDKKKKSDRMKVKVELREKKN